MASSSSDAINSIKQAVFKATTVEDEKQQPHDVFTAEIKYETILAMYKELKTRYDKQASVIEEWRKSYKDLGLRLGGIRDKLKAQNAAQFSLRASHDKALEFIGQMSAVIAKGEGADPMLTNPNAIAAQIELHASQVVVDGLARLEREQSDCTPFAMEHAEQSLIQARNRHLKRKAKYELAIKKGATILIDPDSYKPK